MVGWPQTIHVPPVLHAVASCAPAQLATGKVVYTNIIHEYYCTQNSSSDSSIH